MLHCLGFMGLGTTEIIIVLFIFVVSAVALTIILSRRNNLNNKITEPISHFGMKKYYLHSGSSQLGPFDIDELRQKGILPATSVWCEGLPEWTQAQNVVELQPLFRTAAPPPYVAPAPPPYATPASQFNHAPAQPKPKSRVGLIITLSILLLVVAVGAIVLVNNPNAVPGVKLEINTPKPVVVTSRADGSKSGLLNARTTVYATVMNEGGDGNVLVTFYVYQGNKTYDRSKSIYLRAGTSEDLDVTFEEVDYISGEITYDVMASGE